MFKRLTAFLDKDSKIKIYKISGPYSNYLIRMDDVEIRLHENVLEKLYDELSKIYNGKKKNCKYYEQDKNLNSYK